MTSRRSFLIGAAALSVAALAPTTGEKTPFPHGWTMVEGEDAEPLYGDTFEWLHLRSTDGGNTWQGTYT